jgi:hypothetical protein
MADFSGYSVNDTALHIAVANQLIETIIQNDLYQDGVGIIQITADSFGASAVRVPKIAKNTGKYRELGGANNGGFKNTTAVKTYGLTEEIITLKYLYDHMEDVPNVQSILSLQNAATVSRRVIEIGKAITRGRNAGTLAHQIGAVLNACVTAASGTGRVFTYNPATTGDGLAQFRKANAALDNGDTYHDTYPIEGRLAIWRPNGLMELMDKGDIIVGGSNFAQDMVKSGAVDPTFKDKLPENATGYRGMVHGVPCMVATDPIWAEAETWLGLSEDDLKDFQCVLSSYIATGRGQAFPEQIKVIDSPDVNGLRIQPLSNYGVKVLFEGGIKLITNGAVTFTAVSGDFHDALTIVAPDSQE